MQVGYRGNRNNNLQW